MPNYSSIKISLAIVQQPPISLLRYIILLLLAFTTEIKVHCQSTLTPALLDTVTNEMIFVADTQQPLWIETILHRTNHNTKATRMILTDILIQRPTAIYMLGDIVSKGACNKKWKTVDGFLDSCRQENIQVNALLGNHDLMFNRAKGERNFQQRFPRHVRTGYVSVTDSVAVVMLNSNFKKLKARSKQEQLRWYQQTMDSLNADTSIKFIIVSCHHAPYSNSRVAGSSTQVQQAFVPFYLKSWKAGLFISGHAHAFEHFKMEGKDFLVIGGGGGLHQKMDTSSNNLLDLAAAYHPMFHYLAVKRKGSSLLIRSHFLKADFSAFDLGQMLEIDFTKKR